MSQLTEKEELLEQLTRKAIDAAGEGKWDQVVQFYDRRARAGVLEEVSQDLAKKIMKYDQWVIARIREIQALTQQHLGEAQHHRRRLEALKRQWVGQNTVQARHRLSI